MKAALRLEDAAYGGEMSAHHYFRHAVLRQRDDPRRPRWRSRWAHGPSAVGLWSPSALRRYPRQRRDQPSAGRPGRRHGGRAPPLRAVSPAGRRDRRPRARVRRLAFYRADVEHGAVIRLNVEIARRRRAARVPTLELWRYSISTSPATRRAARPGHQRRQQNAEAAPAATLAARGAADDGIVGPLGSTMTPLTTPS